MYRPEIRVVDCTIRDGGLMNDWKFDTPFVKEVFVGLAKAGVDYVELGYRADEKAFSRDEFGPWRFSAEEDIRQVAYECDTKVAIMCDVGRTDYDAFLPADQSLVSLVRVATYVKQIEEAIQLGRHAKNLGYQVAVNIMAVSHALEPEIEGALEELSSTDFEMVYLVDSFGYLMPEQVHYLAEKYVNALPGKHIGIHCHNNQQLAFANTVESILRGIHYVDASIYGIGRAAGNCPLELILSYLNNPRYDVRPVLDLIQAHFIDLKRDLRWGYEIPYAVTGVLNKHPKAAMAFMNGAHGSTFSQFYDELVNVEEV